MKKIFILLTLVLISVSSLNAQNEKRQPLEQVEYTGTLQNINAMHPTLKTPDGTINLMRIMMTPRNLKVNEGDTVTVTGYKMPNNIKSVTGDEVITVRVTTLKVGNETYILGNGRMMTGKEPRDNERNSNNKRPMMQNQL